MFFLPLFDENPSKNVPLVTWFFIVLCFIIFFYQSNLTDYLELKFIYKYSFIPFFFNDFNNQNPVSFLNPYLTLVTSAFLHAGWMHILGNMLYLWIFGDNVEDSMGSVKFFVFYLQRKDNLDNHDYFNYTYDDVLTKTESKTIPQPKINSTILERFNLSVDSIDLLDNIPSKILNNMELLTKFKNNTNQLIYVYSFAMFPNELQPSGTLNFSHFKNQYIKLNLCDPSKFDNQQLIFRGYYSSYNILTIEDGLTGFRYV